MRKYIVMLCILCSLVSPALARSDLSDISVVPSAVVLAGVLALDLSGAMVVESVEKIGDVTRVVLKGVSDGAKVTLEISGKIAEPLALASAATVIVTATSSGHVLTTSGKVLAFVPNELGKALLYHAPVNRS